MENIRNFGVQNRPTIITTIYVIAILVLLWYLIRFYFAGISMDKTLLGNRLTANQIRSFVIAESDEGGLQMKTGNEYTLSLWLYVKTWDTKQSKAFEVFEQTTDGIMSKLVGGLYPNEPKMFIRSDVTGPLDGSIITSTNTLPECDIVDVAVQRWIHLCISVNGRIMDIYLDGKLARSCILPNVQKFARGTQAIRMYTFDGFYSGIHYQAYAATPDEIYSMYASGPYSSVGFLDFLMEKIGIRLEYTTPVTA